MFSPPPELAATTPPPLTQHFLTLATPPPYRLFPLPRPPPYFTPALYDELALFLLKQQVRYRSIRVLGRGITRDESERCPAIVVDVVREGTDTEEGLEELRRRFLEDRELVRRVPRQVKVVEFRGVIGE